MYDDEKLEELRKRAAAIAEPIWETLLRDIVRRVRGAEMCIRDRAIAGCDSKFLKLKSLLLALAGGMDRMLSLIHI